MDYRRWIIAIAGLGLAGCCFTGGDWTILGRSMGGGAGGTWRVGPGFMPDPMVVSGRAGGTTDASALGPECRGFIAATPNHVLTATGNFPNLRIVANGGNVDLTLVVQRPDGTYLCNDDFEGFHPMVEGPFPAGDYRIFVGTYQPQATGAPYRLGISELTRTTPSAIGGP